jgi:capsular polysaccharide biosynthesis protein
LLNPKAGTALAPAGHFVHWQSIESRRFLTCTAFDVAITRSARAVCAPGLGPIEEFNVGGGGGPSDLLKQDLAPHGSGWRIDNEDVERIAGFSIPFCHYGQTAFGHFVLDGLLQVYLFERQIHDGTAKLVDWPFAFKHLSVSLEACGVPSHARRELRKPAALLQKAGLSSALAAQGVFFPGSYSEPFFNWLRAKFVPPNAKSGNRLYVRRLNRYTRRILNAEDLEALVKSYDFEVFEPEQHSFAEQVRAFAGADVALGTFGSGLTFSPLLGGRRLIIELLPSTVTVAWFVRQATVHRLDYLPIVHSANAEADFVADLPRIDAILVKVLA